MNWSPLVPELLVSNFQRSSSFYVETLGFAVEFTREDPPFAYLSLGEAQLMIQEPRADERWVTGDLHHPYGRGVNFQLEVESIGPYRRRLESDDYPLFEGVRENWYRAGDVEHGNREFLVQDPDGYLLRFVEPLETRRS